MEPAAAAAVLEQALKGLSKKAELTVADAAAKAGLALRDAERGLHFLSTKYRGTLSATDQGELLFKFPHGFSLPLTKQPWWRTAVDKTVGFVRGVGKLVVRAWVSVVLIGYALVFLAIALALAFSGKDDDGRGFGAVYVVLRVISEALFWTFHPFSPIAVDRAEARARARMQREAMQSGGKRTRRIKRFGQWVEIEEDVVDEEAEAKVPFYERVNRFVFGPEPAPKDPREMERRLVAQIRANQGRIGLLDVMKVTGLPREEADPLLARLLLDYDGEVDVSDDGAITYRFESLRKTAGHVVEKPPPPVWSEKVQAPAVTGNSAGSNFLIAAVNAFNLGMAWFSLNANLTIDRLVHWLTTMGSKIPVPDLPYDGIPVVLGVVPLVFSLLLFALPAWRMFRAGAAKKEAAAENARRAVLAKVFSEMDAAKKTQSQPALRDEVLAQTWQQQTGAPPSAADLSAALVDLGGDVDVESGRWRFRDLEAEVAELAKQREQASEQEKSAGEVVYRAE